MDIKLPNVEVIIPVKETIEITIGRTTITKGKDTDKWKETTITDNI